MALWGVSDCGGWAGLVVVLVALRPIRMYGGLWLLPPSALLSSDLSPSASSTQPRLCASLRPGRCPHRPLTTPPGTSAHAPPAPAGCLSVQMVLAIFASMVQVGGPDSGLYFDLNSMQPLGASAAMREALRVYARLLAVAEPFQASSGGCQGSGLGFIRGQCAFALGLPDVFKVGALRCAACCPAGERAVVLR